MSTFCEVPFKVWVGTRDGGKLISHKVFIKSFRKSPFTHKSVNLSFIIIHMKNKLTDLCGNWLLAKRRYKHFLWDDSEASNYASTFRRLIDLWCRFDFRRWTFCVDFWHIGWSRVVFCKHQRLRCRIGLGIRGGFAMPSWLMTDSLSKGWLIEVRFSG